MVRYKTTPEAADANAALIRAVFDELRSRATKDVRYATYRLADGVTFIHVATVTIPPGGEHPLTSLPAFKAFQEKIKERCVEQPVTTELSPLDSYDSRLVATEAAK
jgi:hypothetical protein